MGIAIYLGNDGFANNKMLFRKLKRSGKSYVLAGTTYNQQYVGETTTRLCVRMNGHRSSSTGCLHVINHKKSCVGSEFSIQILEKLIGNGYGDDNKPDPEITNLR